MKKVFLCFCLFILSVISCTTDTIVGSKTNRVYFYPNGGNGRVIEQSFVGNIPSALLRCAFTRPGYTFCGWSETENGLPTYRNNQIVTLHSDKSLYAQWRANSYTVTLVSEGSDIDSFTVIFDEPTPNTAIVPSKVGYTFRGYYPQIEGGGEKYIDSNGNGCHRWDIPENVTLYAFFLENGSHIIQYKNLKGVSAPAKKIFREAENVTLANIALAGYTFDGWFEVVNDITSDVRIGGWSAGAKTSDVTLWAGWTANTYTVTLANDGDVSGDTSITATYNEFLPNLVNLPSKIGQTFCGYWSEAGGSGTQYIDGTGKGTAKWNTVGGATLYVKWSANTYTVTLVNDGDVSGDTSITATYNEIIPDLTNLPSKAGISFDGYWTSPYGAGTRYIDSDGKGLIVWSITDDMTLYANWIYKCNAADLSALLATLDPAGGPYNIQIEDNNPDLSIIKTALTSNIDVPVILDLSECSELTSLGNDALSGCTNLTECIISENVTQIGSYVFNGDVGMSLKYTGTIEQWCEMGFSYMTWFGSDGGDVSDHSPRGKYDLYINGALVTDLIIPDTVTKINDYAFCHCKSITSVTIPDSVQSIGEAAFRCCSSLTSISLPNGLTLIADYTFDRCVSLTNIEIPESVREIGYAGFWGCTSLTEITIPRNVQRLGGTVFYNCLELTTLVVKAPSPPVVYNNRGSSSPVSSSGTWSGLTDCTALTAIRVPDSSVNSYRNAAGWKSYAAKIVAGDF